MSKTEMEIVVKIPTGTAGVFFEFRPESIRDNMYNLNDVYKRFGEPSGKDPRSWARKPSTKTLKNGKTVTRQGPGWDFLVSLGEKLNVGLTHILTTTRGVNGGTIAHYQAYLAYLSYLSPEAQIAINEVVVEAAKEAADPSLKMDRAIDHYRSLGYSKAWIADRLGGKLVRRDFTAELKDHGVNEWGYATCTNAIYEELLGGDANELRRRLKLGGNQRTRDHFNRLQLQATIFAETCAMTTLEYQAVQNNQTAEKACREAGKVTDEAIRKLTGSSCHVQPKALCGF